MKSQEVLSCTLPLWYKKFESDTIQSIIIPLPSEVLEYFQENGTVVLPAENEVSFLKTENSDSDDDWNSEEGSKVIEPDLSEFSTQLKSAIKTLGGSVFPKLNWSSPKDAFWISYNRSLKCSQPSDIYLLLKSSTFVAHDLTSPFKDCEDEEEFSGSIDYCLVLRKWLEINPSEEFRCFVKHKKLFGISQRDSSQYYSYIKADGDLILADIIHFWEEKVRDTFHLSSYVFDVYRPRKNKILLIDFGPFGETTDSLLFSWSELQFNTDSGGNESNGESSSTSAEATADLVSRLTPTNGELPRGFLTVDFRFIPDQTGVQPNPYMQYGLPLDVMNLSSAEVDQVRHMRGLKNGGVEGASSSDESPNS